MVALRRSTPPACRRSLSHYLRQAASIDARGLALLRISCSAIFLIDLALRATALTAHYTDNGLLPRSVRLALLWEYNEPWWMSLHMLSGGGWWQGLLMALAAACAAMLLVGYRTQMALVASWFLLFSLHGRNPLVLQGGDVLLRCLMFWMIFASTGERWSVDAWLRTRRGALSSWQGPYVSSIGTAAILVQLASMYLFTTLLKTAPSWRSDFTAVAYALAGDHYTAPLGYWLLQFPRLMQGLTAGSLVLEFAGPLLLLCPFGWRWMRTFVPLAMVAFHLGLAATMTLGTFPWICGLVWLALLPSEFWNGLEQLVLRRSLDEKAQAPMPATDSQRLAPSGDAKKTYLPALRIAAVLSMLAFVVLLNIKRIANPAATVAGPLGIAGKTLGLSQYWNMFSPGPAEYGGWFRIEATTADGREVNLYQPNQPLPHSKPVMVSGLYPTQHWRRSIVTLWEYEDQPYRDSVLAYFVRQWQQEHPADPLAQARVVQIRTAPGRPAQELVLASWKVEKTLD